MKILKIQAFILCLMLSACAKGNGINLAPYTDAGARPEKFRVCHGFGCSFKTPVWLEEKQWRNVISVFRRTARTPEAERQKIAKAIARMEKHVAKAAGLSPDLGEATTFEKDQHQMDCIDEAINTSMYLKFFADVGALKFHEVAPPVHRGYFINGMWPHNSAAVRELESGGIYVIDSYYEDNGGKVYVVPLDEWLAEWRPANQKP